MTTTQKRIELTLCPECGQQSWTGVCYQGTTEDYDGVSEWQCVCGARFGRWTRARLTDGAIEPRYGGVR